MQRLEYKTVDKTGWGDGPWQSEPDKVQWQDKATGYPCLIVRGPVGALCGYVGVPANHPYHSKDYDSFYDAGVDIEAHGGLTYANSCDEPTEEGYRRAQERFISAVKEMKQYPHGDAAEFVREWGPSLRTYEAYVAKKQQVSICHIASLGDLGEKDGVWWFGFDCAHAWDLMPKMNKHRSEIPELSLAHSEDVYRDMAYVTAECENLAKQLKAVEKAT